MGERATYTCLYTHQLTKKVKSFKDGLFDVKGVGSSRRFALYAAADGNRRAGEPLETGPLPADAPADALDGEELRLDGFLVQVEARLTQTAVAAPAAFAPAATARGAAPPPRREAAPAMLAALPSKKRKAGLSLPPGVVPAAQRMATQSESSAAAADWARPDWLGGASTFAGGSAPAAEPPEPPEPALQPARVNPPPSIEAALVSTKTASVQRQAAENAGGATRGMIDWDAFLAAAPVNEEDQPQAPPSQAGAARALQALSAFGARRMAHSTTTSAPMAVAVAQQYGRGGEAAHGRVAEKAPVARDAPLIPAAAAPPTAPAVPSAPRRTLGFGAQARGSASAQAPLAAAATSRPSPPPPLVLALPAAHVVVRGASVDTACRVCGSGGTGRAPLHSTFVCKHCFYSRHPLPDLFSSVAEYCDAHARALLQELCFGLTDVASAFWSAAPRAAAATAAERQRLFRAAGVPFYGGVDLIIRPQGASAGGAGAGAGAVVGAGEPPSGATLAQLGAHLEESSVSPRVYIRISSEDREPASKVSLGDLWLISSSPAFAAGGMPAPAASWPVTPAPSSSTKDFFASVAATNPFTLLARSAYHAVPPGSGMLELVPLGGVASAALERSLGLSGVGSWPSTLLRGPRSVRVVALRGPSLLTEPLALALLGALRSAPPLSVPLAGLLARGSGAATTLLPSALPRSFLTELATKTVSQCRLNDGQAAVIWQAAAWFTARGETPSATSPCLLVRGVFGSGKSKTLAAMLSFLSASMEESEAAGGPRQRVLVCSATNVAVDRVLTGLVDVLESADIARVGSLRRISRSLLRYALPSSTDSRALASATADLRALMSEGYDGGADKDDVISEKIAGLADSAGLARLSRARVVGVTAASAGATTLADARFDVVILDEATQLTESTALLAIARYGSSRIVLAGDPAQLPPVVFTTPAGVRGGGEAGANTLETSTLFARLNRVGGGLNLPLLTQYRLHPHISRLVSGLFYGGQIRDGVHAGHCPPRFRLCPRVLWFDYSGAHGNAATDALARTRIGPPPSTGVSAHSAGGGSLANTHEADVIAGLVREMLAEPHRVPPAEIFVICLYRAQVSCVTERLGSLAQQVRVGTVDASQGAEFSVVIISTSITSPTNAASDASSGHVHSPQRVCVALSRARSHLIIVGSASSLCASAGPWRTVFAAAAGEAGGLRSSALRPLLAPGPRLAVQSVLVDGETARA